MIDCSNFSHKVRWTLNGQFEDVCLAPILCEVLSSTESSITTKISSDTDENIFSILHRAFSAVFPVIPKSKGRLISKMQKNNGELIEEWHMEGAWPKSVTFGTNGEIEIVWVYDKCVEHRRTANEIPHPSIRRKFRWTVSAGIGEEVILKETFAKVPHKPTLTIEETFSNSKRNAKWDDFSFTICDIDVEDKSAYEKLHEKCNWVKVKMYDGCGTPLEEWMMEDAKCKNINFQELDHSSSEPMYVEFIFEYKSAKYNLLHKTMP